MKHPKMLEFAKNTAKEAGNILMKHFGNIVLVERKSSDIDLLTIADTESESFILEKIHSVYPDHHIIAEESAIVENNSEYPIIYPIFKYGW